jgi:uncharacterized protein (TIGR02001 family)
MRFVRACAPFVLPAGLMSVPVAAQAPILSDAADLAAPPTDKSVAVSGNVALVNNYYFRGISLSNQGWAIQGGMQLDHRSGLFLGSWASSIATVGATDTCTGTPPAPVSCVLEGGSATEVDVFGGWGGKLGPLDVVAGLVAYLYPGASGLDMFEVYGTASYTLSSVTLTLGLNWAPGQPALSSSSRYLFGTLAWAVPAAPVTLKAIIGSERGSQVVDNTGATTAKLDWMVGVDVSGAVIGLDELTLGLGYVGNNLPDKAGANSYAKGGVLFSLGASF